MQYQDLIYKSYLSAHFQSLNSQGYDRLCSAYDMNYRNLLPKDKRSQILDFGCGMGHFLFYLKKKGYSNIIGIDRSEEVVRHCKKEGILQAKHVNDSLEFLNEHKNEFDIIVLNDVMEHFHKSEVVKILQGIHGALRDKGKVIIKVPNMGNPFAAASMYVDFTHEVGYSEALLPQLLQVLNFKNVNCYEEKIYIRSPLKRVIFQFLRKIYHRGLRFLVTLDRPGDNYPTIFSKNIIAVSEK